MKSLPLNLSRLVRLGGSSVLMASALTAGILLSAPRPAAAQMPELVEELDLTAEQRQQLRAIRADYRQQLQVILTDDQQQQLAAALQNRGDGQVRAAIASLELSDDQTAAVRALFGDLRQDIAAVLTEEQRQELRTTLMERRRQRP